MNPEVTKITRGLDPEGHFKMVSMVFQVILRTFFSDMLCFFFLRSWGETVNSFQSRPTNRWFWHEGDCREPNPQSTRGTKVNSLNSRQLQLRFAFTIPWWIASQVKERAVPRHEADLNFLSQQRRLLGVQKDNDKTTRRADWKWSSEDEEIVLEKELDRWMMMDGRWFFMWKSIESHIFKHQFLWGPDVPRAEPGHSTTQPKLRESPRPEEQMQKDADNSE